MKKSLLVTALKIAQDKLPLHPEYDHYIHYTFVVQDNQIVEWGTNNRAVPALHFGYQARLSDIKYKAKTHSEIAAYRKAKGLLRRDKSFDIINIRLSKKGLMRISKPCGCCYNIMKELGCNKFYYSSRVGFLETK